MKMRYLVFLTLLGFVFPLSGFSQNNFQLEVLYVIDGDTIKFLYQEEKESLRLIGIDCPETRKNKKVYGLSKAQGITVEEMLKQGEAAKEYVKDLVKPGDVLKIEFGDQQRDGYGRLLGYVFLSDGRMLNEELLKAGLCGVMIIGPNVKYSGRFLKAYSNTTNISTKQR